MLCSVYVPNTKPRSLTGKFFIVASATTVNQTRCHIHTHIVTNSSLLLSGADNKSRRELTTTTAVTAVR